MLENNANVAVKTKPMDIKKTQTIASAKPIDADVTSKGVFEFVGDVKTELKKISWPSYDELITYTKITVGATFALGMGIYCVDLFIQTFLNSLSTLIRWNS